MKIVNCKKPTPYLAISVIAIMTIYACETHYFRSNYQDTNTLLHATENLQTKPFLKAHLKNGDICILKDSWQIDTLQNLVSGVGSRFDFNRLKAFEGEISIPIDSVAVFETNKKLTSPESSRIAALGIVSGLDIILGIYCLTNPKACFGSCPTFYVNEEDDFHYADAEGFSNAIVPSMEYFDIDALNLQTFSSNSFSITMKNEALETHCVKDVKLLAYPIRQDERVFQSPTNNFYLCENNYPLSQAKAREGDITGLLKSKDQQERFSFSDENNLHSKEEIYLSFEDVKHTSDLGLVLNFRQTLMTTYLFYSAMGYMGDEVGDIFSLLETNAELKASFGATTELLGGIDVSVWNEQLGNWELQNGFNETGPIAINKQFLPLKGTPSNSEIRIKLVLNKGLWRIDFASLTNIKETVVPLVISPESILNKGKLDNLALREIADPDKYLTSMPGSEYKFNFVLPDPDNQYELFVYSKGYYLEWMREHWIKDKDLKKLRQMVFNPATFLAEEASDFKLYESEMEHQFWNSKIDTKTFSYFEN